MTSIQSIKRWLRREGRASGLPVDRRPLCTGGNHAEEDAWTLTVMLALALAILVAAVAGTAIFGPGQNGPTIKHPENPQSKTNRPWR
jgi:hypothetical protein